MAAEAALQQPAGGREGPVAARADQVHHGLRLAEVHPAVEEGPAGEFSRFGRPAAAHPKVLQDLLRDEGIAVAGELERILAGRGGGPGEEGPDDVVEQEAVPVAVVAVAGDPR